MLASPATGILAQYAHLLAYALRPHDGNYIQQALVTLDPRLIPLTAKGYRGIAPTWKGLDGRWNSVVSGYPDKIAAIAQAIKDFRNA